MLLGCLYICPFFCLWRRHCMHICTLAVTKKIMNFIIFLQIWARFCKFFSSPPDEVEVGGYQVLVQLYLNGRLFKNVRAFIIVYVCGRSDSCRAGTRGRPGAGSASRVCWAGPWRCELLFNRHDVLVLAVLIWCRTGVVGGGLALNRHRVCLLGDQKTNRNNSYYHFCYVLTVFFFISCNRFITTWKRCT